MHFEINSCRSRADNTLRIFAEYLLQERFNGQICRMENRLKSEMKKKHKCYFDSVFLFRCFFFFFIFSARFFSFLFVARCFLESLLLSFFSNFLWHSLCCRSLSRPISVSKRENIIILLLRHIELLLWKQRNNNTTLDSTTIEHQIAQIKKNPNRKNFLYFCVSCAMYDVRTIPVQQHFAYYVNALHTYNFLFFAYDHLLPPLVFESREPCSV